MTARKRKEHDDFLSTLYQHIETLSNAADAGKLTDNYVRIALKECTSSLDDCASLIEDLRDERDSLLKQVENQ